MIPKVVHGFDAGLEKTVRARLQRQTHSAAGAFSEFDEMRGHTEHVLREGGDNVRTCDARLEAKRRALDRRRRSLWRYIRQHLRDIDGVLRTLLRAPISFVDLFLHDSAFEWTVRECVHCVEIHVIVVEKFLELVALRAAIN